nr:MAG TPA: hypothetical protein [Caudoviricetes sp.]
MIDIICFTSVCTTAILAIIMIAAIDILGGKR